MSEEYLENIIANLNDVIEPLKMNQCNISTKEKGWETYYGLDDKLIKYIRKIENENKKQKEVLDKIKEYIKRKDLVNTNEITNGNIKYILELLEETECLIEKNI